VVLLMRGCARKYTYTPALLAGLLSACSQGGLGAMLSQLRGDPYALDDQSRDANPGDPCPELALQTYSGELLRFQPPLKIAVPFATRLAQFEAVVKRVSLETYGRAPSAIRHAGAYLCRPIRARASRWSEHAFGNAIDIVGFDFARVRKADAAAASDAGVALPGALPPPLRKTFQVRVGKHWAASQDELSQLHSSFLHRLVTSLQDEEVFRAMIGPPDPSHLTHLHFDMGPWRYQRI
jgi:hypothetical protein